MKRSASAGRLAIEPLSVRKSSDAARALARAFVTNPLHVVVFGPSALKRNEAFFTTALRLMKGPKLVATLDSEVVGAIHWVMFPDCQFSLRERARSLASMFEGLGVRPTLRLVSWLSIWARHDPREQHLHLGPIGVSPESQGLAIGRRLMDGYCAEIDRLGVAGYLETDRPENVTFYQRFGFEVMKELPVPGVRNYLMWRAKQ
jgi:GNAT superfamily N-acetyltransferase